MSARGSQITCRRCNETFPVEDGSCPHCGKGVRNTTSLAIVAIIGVVIVAASLVQGLFFFGGVGAIVAASAGYLIYRKRQRIEAGSASETADARLSVEE